MFVIECRKIRGGKAGPWFMIFKGQEGGDAAQYLKVLVLAEHCLEGFPTSEKREYHMRYLPETVQPPPVPEESMFNIDELERGTGGEE